MSFLRKIRGQSGSLRARSLSAGLWTLGGVATQRALTLASNLIMTRFLVPEDFGLMAIVITVMMLVGMISDIGIRQSIVREARGEDLYFLRVAWTVQILRSAVIAGVVLLVALTLWALAPSLAGGQTVYSDRQLPALIAVSALGIVFAGLESVALHVETRNLRQKQVVLIEIGTQAFTLAAMIMLVQVNPTVWVLLFGLLIAGAVRMVWTHLAFRNRPMWLAWDRDIAADLWNFGKWLIGSSLAGFVVNNGDRFLMGALLPKETFGFYVIATLWIQAGQTVVAKVYNKVVYPSMSDKLRQDAQGFPLMFRRIRLVLDVALGTIFLIFLFGGPVLVSTLYLPEYAPAGVFISLLSLRFLTQRQSIWGMLLMSAGDSKQLMFSILVSACALVALAMVAFWTSDIQSVVMAVAIAPALGGVVLTRAAKRHYPTLSSISDIALIVVLVGLLFSAIAVS